MVLGASAGGPASQGGGEDGDSGQMSARPAAETDTPETRALGKHAVSPLGSTAEVEQAAAGLAPPRVERALESGEGRPASADTGAAPPPPLQRRDVVKKRLGIRSGQKRQAEVPAFAPRKALKVGTGSIAPGAVEVQELVAQVGATQAAVGREEEEEPTLHEVVAPVAVEATVGAAETPSAVEATEGEVGVEAPSVVEATEGEVEVEAPSVVEATEGEVEVEAPTVVEALRTSGAEVVEIAAPRNFGARVVEAGVSTARVADLEVETEARQASTLPPIQSVLPELEARSFGKSLFLRRERGVWDELCRQRELLAHANELLSARSAEAEDLRLRCDNREAEAATAQGQVTPLVARVKELEEELTRVADERDASNSWAEEVRATVVATAGQLGAEQRAHELTKGALAEATKAAEGLDDEVSRLTEASVALQTVLDREIEEHDVL
ncbi:uncharacterized protein [Miscanthus floridulus]|uniref:uncharacterized protein n=1 Tax=Miscanthus floridulus TaxID=154761 RepID=UPI003459FD6B